MNVKTPASGMARAFGSKAVGTAETSDLAHRTPEIQTSHMRRRFNLSPAVAAAVAAHCFSVPEHWSCRT
jgi:hypothetical protein